MFLMAAFSQFLSKCPMMNSTPFERRIMALVLSGLLLATTMEGQTLTNRFSFEEFLLVPVRVHLLSAKDSPAIQTTLTEKDISRIWKKVNGVWSQAGLHYYLESLVREEANHPETHPQPEDQADGKTLLSLRPAASRATNVFHVYYLKNMEVNGIYFLQGIFVKNTASLRRVEGGIDEPLPRVTSHELGHAFTLPHRQNNTNLMASGTTGTWLNEEEIDQARKAARSLNWIVAAPDMMKQAEALFRANKLKEAATLYARLATIPLKADETELAKKRVETLSR